MFRVADDTLSELDPAVAEATLAAADALRKVLEAQEQLNSHRSEVSLKQLIAVLRETSPELQQACWLLMSQQEAYKSQARTWYTCPCSSCCFFVSTFRLTGFKNKYIFCPLKRISLCLQSCVICPASPPSDHTSRFAGCIHELISS